VTQLQADLGKPAIADRKVLRRRISHVVGALRAIGELAGGVAALQAIVQNLLGHGNAQRHVLTGLEAQAHRTLAATARSPVVRTVREGGRRRSHAVEPSARA
jgi:hypothetical protein